MKAKELRGIVPIQLKDGQTYKMEFTFNSICELEDKLGSIEKVFEEITKPTMKNTRMLLWAGLWEHHEMTEKEVGRLLDFNVIGQVTRAVEKGINFAFPTTEGPAGEQEVDEMPDEMKAVLQEAKAKN
ncbi:hypothetical protein FZC84_21265 [Rossellomorea vietnamensis]|uniref:Uncharacterized protein n=1 Tax=Rossellomorea vietnamensis TaxID=218284 RepID=A0A5D4M1B3_9BACI|nr:hypothetical protein [Rossellomorea vietnamensis]TYR95724.1 hypothetical protein FZC84_21265 [Rossellomorea vietnamensis]